MTDSRRPRTKNDVQDAADELRRQAEKRLDELSTAVEAADVPEGVAEVVHELRVHQIELEMQNEELRRAQLELDDQRQKYFELFDLAPVGYLTLSTEGIVGDANFTAARLLGVERSRLVGQPFSRFIVAPDQDVYYRHIKRFDQTEQPQTCELRLRRAEDTAKGDATPRSFWAHLDGHPRRIADDDALWCWLTFSDIDERVAAEEEIRRLNEVLELRVLERTRDLEASNRELEAFVYSAAHDLRSPLRAIDGFSQIVVEDASERLNEPDKENLQRVRVAAERMGKLIDHLIELSRTALGDMLTGEVDLSAMATEVLADLQSAAPERCVETVVEPSLTVTADPALLQVVLMNLLGNAWKFTSRHGTARIEVGAADLDGERVFYVRDDGAGFEAGKAEHLFDAFQRLHTADEFPGDGIGLATVRRLITRHGGRVWAEAEVEKGATFFFTLPVSAGA